MNNIAFDPKNALIRIKCPVGSSINAIKDGDTIYTLAASMGIVDNTDVCYAYYYCTIEPKNFGTITFNVSCDAVTTYVLEASINSNKYYSYSITDFT